MLNIVSTDAEGQSFSSHDVNDLVVIDRTSAARGSLVGHVDDDAALGVVLEENATIWRRVLWTVTPNLTTGGIIANALRQALSNEIGECLEKARMSYVIENVMYHIKQRTPIDTWKVDLVTSLDGKHTFNVTFREYGKGSYSVITLTA